MDIPSIFTKHVAFSRQKGTVNKSEYIIHYFNVIATNRLCVACLGSVRLFYGLGVSRQPGQCDVLHALRPRDLALSDQNGSSSLALNSRTAKSPPDISLVRVGPGTQVKWLFRAPAPQ
jgi:hypothetical protein